MEPSQPTDVHPPTIESLKVLISAYACEPNRGSEPGVGWNWALQAARHHDVWVLTRSNNRQVIEAELNRNPQPRLHFIYHDLPKWARCWKRGNRGIHLYYYLWQLTAIRSVRAAHTKNKFDITHHITMVSNRFPSMLAWLDLPFIWGPLAGAETAPLTFYSIYGFRGAIHHALRDISNSLSGLDPLVRKTRRKASAKIAVTPETANAVGGAIIEPAIGITPALSTGVTARCESESMLRLLYVGNLLYLKGLQLALPAIANAKKAGVVCSLTIIGSGAYETTLRHMATKLGVSENILFRGQLPYTELEREYLDHDVFLFPSMRDSGGMAVLEAMTNGLPVICLDLGGPGLTVTPETGIAVPARSPNQVIRDLTEAIISMYRDPELVRAMGEAAKDRARTAYAWDRIGEFLRDLYPSVLAEQDSR